MFERLRGRQRCTNCRKPIDPFAGPGRVRLHYTGDTITTGLCWECCDYLVAHLLPPQPSRPRHKVTPAQAAAWGRAFERAGRR